MYINSISILLY